MSRAEALFKKEQQLREGQQAMAEYQVELLAMREKTARLRALRLARDAANQNAVRRRKLGAAVAHIDAIDDGITKRSAALDDPPTHGSDIPNRVDDGLGSNSALRPACPLSHFLRPCFIGFKPKRRV